MTEKSIAQAGDKARVGDTAQLQGNPPPNGEKAPSNNNDYKAAQNARPNTAEQHLNSIMVQPAACHEQLNGRYQMPRADVLPGGFSPEDPTGYLQYQYIVGKPEVTDTVDGGKHIKLGVLGEGNLTKQDDGTYKGKIISAPSHQGGKPDENEVTLRMDGTIVTNIDGDNAEIKRKADGSFESLTVKQGAGNWFKTNADGTGEGQTNGEGHTWKTNADGSVDDSYSHSETHFSQSSIKTTYENKSSDELLPNGVQTHFDAATGATTSKVGGITTIKYPNGTEITEVPNQCGVTSITKVNGNTTIQHADGSVDIVLANGQRAHTPPASSGNPNR
jgi:hypothetical protein